MTNKAHRENRIQLKAPDKALMAFNYVFVSLSNYYEYLKTPWMIIPRRLNVEAYKYVFRNASSEAGVGFNGASARQPNAREGGIAEGSSARGWARARHGSRRSKRCAPPRRTSPS